MDYSIFFAASPIHLMCIYELHKKSPERKYELILLVGKDKFANSQLYKTLKILGFRNYTTIQLHKNLVVNYLNGIRLIVRLYKRFNSYNLTIAMIDFRNSFMHSLRCFFNNATFILIDDGFHTYVAYEKYLQYDIYLPVNNYTGVRGNIVRWLYYGKCYNKLIKDKIELFSLYFDYFDANKVTGARNDFSSYKNTVLRKPPPVNSQDVYFIGTKHSERGAMKLEDELYYVEWLKNYWQAKGKRFFYVAKRSSSITKILLIEKLNIPCLRFDLPLEMALINNNSIPGIICSTGSTLLKTLPILYDSIEYYLVDVSAFYVYKADRDIFEYSKKFCNSHHLKILNILR